MHHDSLNLPPTVLDANALIDLSVDELMRRPVLEVLELLGNEDRTFALRGEHGRWVAQIRGLADGRRFTLYSEWGSGPDVRTFLPYQKGGHASPAEALRALLKLALRHRLI